MLRMHHAAPIGELNKFELQYRPSNMSHLPPLSAPQVRKKKKIHVRLYSYMYTYVQ